MPYRILEKQRANRRKRSQNRNYTLCETRFLPGNEIAPKVLLGCTISTANSDLHEMSTNHTIPTLKVETLSNTRAQGSAKKNHTHAPE